MRKEMGDHLSRSTRAGLFLVVLLAVAAAIMGLLTLIEFHPWFPASS
jgi:hypothetical protein